MGRVRKHFNQLPPGTALSVLSAVAQALFIVSPLCFYTDAGPDYFLEEFGYTIFTDLQHPSLFEKHWSVLFVPLGILVALLGLFKNRQFPQKVRIYGLIAAFFSILSLASLIWFLFYDVYRVTQSGGWLSMAAGLLILLGNILDIGFQRSPWRKIHTGLVARSSVLKGALATAVSKVMARSTPLVRVGLLVLSVGIVAGSVLLTITYFRSPRPFKNYMFECPRQGEEILGTSEGLAALCSRMQQNFAESNLTTTEANQFYALLQSDQVGMILHNERYPTGAHPLKHFSMRRQVMIKRVSTEKYEVFYYRFDFYAVEYEYGEVYLSGGAIASYVSREKGAQWNSSWYWK